VRLLKRSHHDQEGISHTSKGPVTLAIPPRSELLVSLNIAPNAPQAQLMEDVVLLHQVDGEVRDQFDPALAIRHDPLITQVPLSQGGRAFAGPLDEALPEFPVPPPRSEEFPPPPGEVPPLEPEGGIAREVK